MRTIFTLVTILFFNSMFSQIGISTSDPKVALDIAAQANDINFKDGLLIPRITGEQLKAKDPLYGLNEHSTLIFVTAAANPTTSKTRLVTTSGFYFYDAHTEYWKRINTTNAPPVSDKIINTNFNKVNAIYKSMETKVLNQLKSKDLNFNISKSEMKNDFGFWNSEMTKFTITKSGIYSITAGAKLASNNNFKASTNLIVGTETFAMDNQKSKDKDINYLNSNITTTLWLKEKDVIYVSANTDSSPWYQEKNFLLITYSELSEN